jgi:four helix bundle protein
VTSITRFEEIEAWKTARKLTNRLYELTKEGNFARDYSLRDQMRRAAVSIMSNISEGFESRTNVQFIEYLGRAKASAGELRAQLYIALDQEYYSEVEFRELIHLAETCSRQIYKFMEYLNSLPNLQRVRESPIDYDAEEKFD